MKLFLKIAAGVFAAIVLAAAAGAGYVYLQREALLQRAVTEASTFATETLGTRVEIGNAFLGKESPDAASDLVVTDLIIYDRNSEVIARAERAEVNIKLLALLDNPLSAFDEIPELISAYNDPASVVDEITVQNVEAFIVKRDDGGWNFEDIKTGGGGESDFNALIKLVDGDIHANINDPGIGEIDANDLNVELKFYGTKNVFVDGTVERINLSYEDNPIELADTKANVKIRGSNEIKAHVKTNGLGSELIVDASRLGSRETFDVSIDRAVIGNYMPFLPIEKIPEGVEILDGTLTRAKVNVIRQGDELKFNGRSDVNGGSVRVEDTIIDSINGSTTFNNKAIQLAAALAANDQHAEVSGTIRIDTETPYFDINASSDRFQPSAVLNTIPVDSVAALTAHLTGTVDRPFVEADIEVPSIEYEGLYASNISTHFKYFDNAVYLSDFRANTFGGSVEGDVEFQATNYAFNAHMKTHSIDADRLIDFVPALEGVSGSIDADLGVNGISDDLSKLKIYGSATASDIYVRNIPINRIDTSFYAESDDVRIDYLSAAMPNHGSLGLEGTITDGKTLDFNFYGGHVDLAFINNFIPSNIEAHVGGLSDFKGTIKGAAENPAVDLKFTAIDNSAREGDHFKGVLLNQPFDSVKFSAKGSLDQVSVSDFQLTKDGMDHWLAEGTVGLTGDQKINLVVDTVGARAEDIIDLIAPDQKLTGNVDNIIRITGTLDKPEVVGYVHFWRGSYQDMLVSGMDGDYFVEGNTIRVQDFHVYTPMLDMDLNGTIDKVSTAMDFVVQVHDIDMRRMQGKFPEGYSVGGHGKFEGIIKGDLNEPIFDGLLTADSLFFNGVEVNNVIGDVGLNGDDILLDNFSFKQGSGTYNVHGAFNYNSGTLHGSSVVENAAISELLAMSNLKNGLLEGNLNSKIRFGGSLDNPSLNIVGTVPEGSIGGTPVRDIMIDVNLINHVAYINKLEGYQGEAGSLIANGTAALDGPLNVTLAATDLSLDLFTGAAGLDPIVNGTASFNATIEGSAYNPIARGELIAVGTGKDPLFDRIHGNFDLQNGIVNLKNLIMQRSDKDKFYQASAKGKIPFEALTAKSPSELPDNEQLDLTLTLDNGNLSILPVLSEYLAWAMGDTHGELKITGTAAHPLVNGTINLTEGSMKFKTVKSPVEHMNVSLKFTGNRMEVEKFDGMIGTGTYNLTGGFGFEGFETTDYDFKFVADKLMLKSDFFEGPLSMEFEFNEGLSLLRERLPKIAGHIDFDNCQISVPTIPESEGELPRILIDVAINVGEKVHFYTPYLYDLYLEKGNVRFEGATYFPKPSGTLAVKRGGTLNYLKTIFKIQEGVASFDQLQSFLPSLKFKAESKLTQARVFLNLEGTLGNANFTLTSSPEMTHEEIIQLLTFRDAYQKGGDTELDAGDLLTLGLQLSILSEIEGAVRKTFGFDQFTISRGSGSAFDHHGEEHNKFEEEYNVQLGKYITDNVMLKYTRGIGGDNINRYGFQYDFNDNMGLTVERENHDFIFGVEARWRF